MAADTLVSLHATDVQDFSFSTSVTIRCEGSFGFFSLVSVDFQSVCQIQMWIRLDVSHPDLTNVHQSETGEAVRRRHECPRRAEVFPAFPAVRAQMAVCCSQCRSSCSEGGVDVLSAALLWFYLWNKFTFCSLKLQLPFKKAHSIRSER